MNAHHKKRTYRPSPPKSTARYSSGSFEVEGEGKDEGKVNKLRKAAERQAFGWQLDVLLPAVGTSISTQLAGELETLVKESNSFCLCEGLNLADLLEPEFMNSFIRKGSLVTLSLDDSEGADVVAIDGRGRLILSVCKDTYELLGLPGRASAHGSLRQRFIIEISLIDPFFRAGKPGFERTKRLLRDWPAQTDLFDALTGIGTNGATASQRGRTFDLVMSYRDEHGALQPIALPSSASGSARRIESTFTSHMLSSIRVPKPSSFPSSSSASEARKRPRTSSGAFRKEVDGNQVFWEEYREWAGLVQLGEAEKVAWRESSEGEQEEDEWGLPLEMCEKGEVSVSSWTGLLHPKAIARMVDSLTRSEAFRQSPFVAITLRPFPHSPLSHLSAASPPVVGSSKLPNGKKRKRGRGRGEEEEAERGRLGEAGGWEMVVQPGQGGKVEWHLWEGQ
ncbi:hypothetical protein JCM11251_000350 [Rhodosporidiobolus azoricus]